MTGSDSVGMTMGYYDTTQLPIYKYLHGKGAPKYVIADRFFQAAFGGSFLNHQYLIAAAPPPQFPAATRRTAQLDPRRRRVPDATLPALHARRDAGRNGN